MLEKKISTVRIEIAENGFTLTATAENDFNPCVRTIVPIASRLGLQLSAVIEYCAGKANPIQNSEATEL